MKELSIEEKAKELDASLERAKKLIETCDSTAVKGWCEYIFPMLKEPKTEDERIRKEILAFIRQEGQHIDKYKWHKWIAWLEKQGNKVVDCQQNHQDLHPHGCIVLEDFNGGEGFYKLHLDYLNNEQVKDVEEMVRMWNKVSKITNENESIKNCIGMCLTDVSEQRFKDYNTSLKDCLAWLEKQGNQSKFLIGSKIF